LQAPAYDLTGSAVDRGTSALRDDERFHMTVATFTLLHQWFAALKAEGAYDNTRVVLVSDHGRGTTDYPGNIVLPNGVRLQSYNPLLMVKDFGDTTKTRATSDSPATSDVTVDTTFMTNADAALLAAAGTTSGVNPFTQKALVPDKDRGIAIATVGALSTYRHGTHGYTIGDDQWLRVREDIFDTANWNGGAHD
jgi:arylsulfatase A-like enzyme